METIKKFSVDDSYKASNIGNLSGNNRDIEFDVNEYLEQKKYLRNIDGILDPMDSSIIQFNNNKNVNIVDGKVSERRKVEYSEKDIEDMARIVQREANIEAGRAGTIAVAEEIRNRVLTDIDPTYMPDTLHGVLYAKDQYTPSDASSPLAGTEEAREDVKQICRDVLDGKLWVFGQDNVYSHASHEGTELYESQKGIPNSEFAAAFYYDDLGVTQSFYSIGESRETVSNI